MLGSVTQAHTQKKRSLPRKENARLDEPPYLAYRVSVCMSVCESVGLATTQTCLKQAEQTRG